MPDGLATSKRLGKKNRSTYSNTPLAFSATNERCTTVIFYVIRVQE